MIRYGRMSLPPPRPGWVSSYGAPHVRPDQQGLLGTPVATWTPRSRNGYKIKGRLGLDKIRIILLDTEVGTHAHPHPHATRSDGCKIKEHLGLDKIRFILLDTEVGTHSQSYESL